MQDQKIKGLEEENTRRRGQAETEAAAARLTPGLEKAQRLLTAGEKQMDGASHALAQTDFRLLAKDAGSVARRRRLIDKLRRLADELEKQMF